MHCEECEHIDDILFDTTVIWFYAPTVEVFSRIAALAGRMSLDAQQFNHKGIAVTVARSKVDGLVTALFGELNGKELAESRVLTTAGAEPNVVEMGRIMAGDVFVNRIKSQWLVESLRARRYETHFQPIVYADGPNVGRPFAMECLFRIRDNTDRLIPPGYVFKLADQAGLLFPLDLAARASAVETASKNGYADRLFINFNPSSIYDPSYCLRETAAVIDELGYKPEQITFEITETHQVQDKDHLKGILAFYRRAGFKVALDDIGAGWSGLNMLHEITPDFVKIDMDLVRGIDRDPLKQTIVRHLIAIARELDIQLIAEGIETVAEAEVLREMGAHYLQGYLYARPGPMESGGIIATAA